MEHAPLAKSESYWSIEKEEISESAEANYSEDENGCPIVASIVNMEKSRGRVSKFTNPYEYTIELNHGPYQWTIKRLYSDFKRLNKSLRNDRATALITQPPERIPEASVLTYSESDHLLEKSDHIRTASEAVSSISKISGLAIFDDGPQCSAYCLGQAEKASLMPQYSEASDRNATSGRPRSEASKRSNKAKLRRASGCDVSGLVPAFPIVWNVFVRRSKLDERKKAMERYLQAVLEVEAHRHHPEIVSSSILYRVNWYVVIVSRLLFIENFGPKGKEGVVKRRRNRCRWLGLDFQKCCLACYFGWKDGWLIVKDSFVAILDRNNIVHDVILFGKNFEVTTRSQYLGDQRRSVRSSLFISNGETDLILKCGSAEEATEWKTKIDNVIANRGSVWTDDHRFGSSFPIREDCFAQWLVDGRSYMEQAADAMELAKEDIFIAGFIINAQIYMKRPIMDDRWRLDVLLKRKADEGVRIFILLYKEVANFLPGIGSYETEKYFMSLSPNIKVLRHPDFVSNVTLLWARHEKLIVVDQKMAFVGGIDLCYGRWDDPNHRLVDLGNKNVTEIPETELKLEYAEGLSQVNGHYNHQNSDAEEHARNVESQDTQRILKSVECTQKNVKESITSALQTKLRLDESGKLWPGKDYENSMVMDMVEPEKAFEDLVDRTVIPRMPWHDAACLVYGSTARDVARHFIQCWNLAKMETSDSDTAIPFLLPKSHDNAPMPKLFRHMALPCKAQVLRSADTWSTGQKFIEDSIYKAYLSLIEEAEHYVYIENPFFVSNTAGPDVVNKISEAIFNRIVRAHQSNETFRVYIMLPLLPAYVKTSGAMQMELHFTYMTISKGETSLLSKLKEAVGDPSPYISFCSLRTHDDLMGQLVTEQIYVHSKIIIVDDRKCLIGTANINDRSLLGGRDSELAVLFEDTRFSSSSMNGRSFEAGVFATSLRKRFFQEYLGVLQDSKSIDGIDLSDPVSADFYNFWRETAEKNSRIYEKVFDCPPADSMKTLEQWHQKDANKLFLAYTNKGEALKLLQDIRGHLVAFSTEFLSNTDLSEKPSLESWMPRYIFT